MNLQPTVLEGEQVQEGTWAGWKRNIGLELTWMDLERREHGTEGTCIVLCNPIGSYYRGVEVTG